MTFIAEEKTKVRRYNFIEQQQCNSNSKEKKTIEFLMILFDFSF